MSHSGPLGGSGGDGGRRDSGVPLPDSWDVHRREREPSVGAATVAPPPHHRRPPYLVLVVGGAAVLLATVAAAAIAWQLTEHPSEGRAVAASVAPVPSPPVSSPVAPTAAAPTPTVPTASVGASAAAAPTASASASTSAAPVEVPASPGECFASLLPEGALGDPPPDLSGSCKGEDGYASMLKLKAALVRVGGGAVTPAMSEWSILGWHETAAFAIMRAHCCPDAPVLKVSETFAKCRMDESLAYLVNALDDDDKMREAREAYRAAAKCIAGSGWGGSFNQYGFPHDGELKSLDRIWARVRKARGR